MVITKERKPVIRSLRGRAIDALQDAGAIRECEEHGWMRDRAVPQALARQDQAVSTDQIFVN